MKDDPSEFSSVINLIIPMTSQFPTDKLFMNTYFDDNGIFKTSMVQDFTNHIKGRVSYLKAMTSEVQKVFIGTKFGNLKHFIVYLDRMSEFQSEHYLKAYERDKTERSIFINSRQSSLFVFPDGTSGNNGFSQSRYVLKRRSGINRLGRPTKTNQTKIFYSLGQSLIYDLSVNNIGSLSKLAKFSSKYANTIKIINESYPSTTLVYCEYVNGSGAILFAKILELFGFSESSGKETTKQKRYILLTNQTVSSPKRLQLLINKFNNDENIDGEYISVIIGSRVISEGFTFKNIRKILILTPHWNYSETAQVIARGWRLGSHNALIERGDENINVNVYQQVSLPNNSSDPSIDLEMYETSEKKDVAMKQIEYIVKKSAFDCPLTIDRNKIQKYDNMRECDYTDCNYSCDGVIETQPDSSTYNLYHAVIQTVQVSLEKYFRIKFFATIEELFARFPQLERFEVVNAIKTIINKDIQFINKYGHLSYLRIQNNIVFISSDPKISSNKFIDYYSKNLIIQNGDPFSQIVKEMYDLQIPTIIQTIFWEPQYLRSIIVTLPEIVQRIILQGCIQAEDLKIEKNKDARHKILNFYKGFYDKIDNTDIAQSSKSPFKSKWVIWLYKENIGVVCFENNEWVSCENKDPTVFEEYIAKKRLVFIKSPVGFYGLYNPQLDDFCIRDVRNANKQLDLRKMTVGRRCTDWDQKTLIDLAVRKMKIPIPDDAEIYSNLTFDQLKQLVENTKYSKPEDTVDEESMHRFLHWKNQIRVNLCKTIKEWFERNNLIEENFDCGTQKKQRVNFGK